METEKKVEVLLQALPYIKKYHDKIVVIKFGRNITAEVGMAEVSDIVMLQHVGMKPVVVHGGGPSISAAMEKAGIEPKFVDGLRVSDEKTVQIVDEVYSNIRQDLINLIDSSGGKARGLKGQDFILAKQKNPQLQYVGDVTQIKPKRIFDMLSEGIIPVISPLAYGQDGKTYNVNADSVAAALAVALEAEKLTMMTNVAGVLDDGKLISHLTIDQTKKMIQDGIINGGMIPKVQACIEAVENNVPKAHLIDGTKKNSLLLEVFTDEGIGTEFVKNGN